MCIDTCIFIYIYIHTYISIRVHLHKHTHTHTHTHTAPPRTTTPPTPPAAGARAVEGEERMRGGDRGEMEFGGCGQKGDCGEWMEVEERRIVFVSGSNTLATH